jgi:hypothetical protein
VQLFVQQTRFSDRSRRITSVAEVGHGHCSAAHTDGTGTMR